MVTVSVAAHHGAELGIISHGSGGSEGAAAIDRSGHFFGCMTLLEGCC